VEFLEHFDLESLIKLLVATGLGALVGLEREVRGRPAGLRTNALVCLASALLIELSRTGALVGLVGPDNLMLNVDPARMAAGIVTGIGFLGAGAILRVRESLVRGLTTAAGIWFVAAIGVAVGLGAYVLSVAATVLAILILTLLNTIERRLAAPVYRTLTVTVTNDLCAGTEDRCRELLKKERMRVQQVTYDIDNEGGQTRLTFAIRSDARHDTRELASSAAALEGVAQVGWS
jgi:putative Mg2+ transporter-C (MgtC) family protein